MQIVTQHHGYGGTNNWSAIDASTYDGAEDTKHPFNAIGWGPTQAEAIADLQSQLES